MGKVIFGMTMSLDGYINDVDGSLSKLYPDFNESEFQKYINDGVPTVGAVVMGRHTYEKAEDPDSYADNYEYQVPIFVLCSKPPAKHPMENENVKISFHNGDIAKVISAAKKVAGDKCVVIVGGPNVGTQVINANLIDELHVDIIPILIKAGTRLFENIDRDVKLKKIKVQVVGERVSIQYKVIKDDKTIDQQ